MFSGVANVNNSFPNLSSHHIWYTNTSCSRPYLLTKRTICRTRNGKQKFLDWTVSRAPSQNLLLGHKAVQFDCKLKNFIVVIGCVLVLGPFNSLVLCVLFL